MDPFINSISYVSKSAWRLVNDRRLYIIGSQQLMNTTSYLGSFHTRALIWMETLGRQKNS